MNSKPIADPSEAQRVQELLADEEFRYQSIELPGGVRTAGTDRSSTLDKILPADLTGKSVLDIGCRYGFFSFEAAKRGASRVLGVDFDQDALNKAQKVAALGSLPVEFRQADVSKNDITETFDIVLCLNVLHHLRDPIGVLNHLIDLTNETLILEVAGFSGRDQRRLFRKSEPATWLLHPLPLAQFILDRLPIIMLGSDKRAFESNFFFSRAAVRSLLLHRNRVFWKADVFSSPFKGRFLCIAEKLRFDDMLVVAGPSGAGKSRLIDRLTRNELPELAKLASADTETPWTSALPNHLEDLPSPHVKKLAYHYDLLRPYLRGPFNYSRDRAIDVFKLARNLSIVTMIASPAELGQRWNDREIQPRMRLGYFTGPKRSKKMAKVLQDRQKVVEVYDIWFDFLKTQPGKHYLLDSRDGAERLLPVSSWKDLRSAF